MGGHVGAESEPESGSTFWFVLPMLDVSATATRADKRAVDPHWAARRFRGKVLLVEDNAVNQKVSVRILEKLGYYVDTVANGAEAVDKLQNGLYDAVLMDCQMPVMDGYAATREIRRREGTSQRCIIIAMTASAMTGDRERCLASGMDDYLAKPIRPEDVRQIIERWGTTAALPDQPDHAAEPPPLKTTPASAESDHTPVDMDRLLDFSDNDPESLNELISLYFQQTTGQMEQITAALQSGNASDVQRLAHSCAGASATCGMIRLAPMLRELEKLGHDRNLANAKELFARITAEFESVKKYLNNYLATHAKTPVA
jgi:CheY-like chemotaxis protein/HPt (histidine-containing phosphotransfer) domain-containing protein